MCFATSWAACSSCEASPAVAAAVSAMSGSCDSSIWLKQVKERKNENPDQVYKVPEQAGDLNSIGEMLGVALVKLCPNGQPEVREDNHPTEDVQSVESGDGEIAGEVR